MLTEESRKPVDQLTLDDLSVFPAWEFCLDEEGVEGQDETWVRPFIGSTIPAEAWLQVGARFTLNDGVHYDGYVDVSTGSMEDLVELLGKEAMSQPRAVIIVDGRQASVPTKAAFDYDESREELANVLGRDFAAIFPIKYELKMLVEGEQKFQSGELN